MNFKLYKKSFFTGCLCGIFLYLLMYGFGRLMVWNDAWTYTSDLDLAQHHLGWCLYRIGTWQFPIGLTDAMQYPSSTSVIYTDSIPLWAVFFKLLRGILPAHFQYIGLYGLVCFMLQGGIFGIIAQHYSDSRILCIITSLLGILSPVMLYRMYYHTALASHFLILIALYIWFFQNKISYKAALLFWCIMGIISSGTHIYFIPMIGLILTAFCIRVLFEHHFSVFQALSLPTAYCGICALTIWILGGFHGSSVWSTSGYGWYNANLNTFFNGQGTNALTPILPISRLGQDEGYGYLGLGILFLILFLIISSFHRTSKAENVAPVLTKPLLVSAIWLFLISLFFAIIPTITFQQYELIRISFSQNIISLLSIFRANGRFIWIPVYMIFLFALRTFFTYSRSKKQTIILLSICLCLQVLDTSTYLFQWSLPSYDSTSCVPEELEELCRQNPSYDKILFMDHFTAGELYDYAEFASCYQLKLSQFNVSRSSEEDIEAGLTVLHASLDSGNPDKNAIYIFKDTIPESDSHLTYIQTETVIIGIME